MQISQYVRVRGARWRIVDIRAGDGCRIVTLAGAAPPNVGIERRVLTPFDDVEPIERRRTPRAIAGRRWRRACRALIAADTPPGRLRSVRSARLDVLPHQLAPALAVLRGDAARVLLADAVGLGKTIQAALVAAELLDRGLVERVLVITPAGLRDQWIRELADRVGVGAVGVDARVVRRRTAELPLGVNPWSTIRVAAASVDYIKRTEVLPALLSARWDLVIVDEAHNVAGDSDRRIAVDRLARRASHVILITATPHNGDRTAFASLCALGAVNADPLLLFRRTRADVGLDSRRTVRVLRVRPHAAERRMHALLERYAQAVRAERAGVELALSTLVKRACSSPRSLEQSVRRRLASLGGANVDGDQLALPLGDPSGELLAADEAPAWPPELALADGRRERRLLTAVADAAANAVEHETKVRALRRVLRRTHESAVVFTEYRDTLIHVQQALAGLPVLTLHGGMTRQDRDAVVQRFVRQPTAILLATDAAGEGLNLHHACRRVINLELPWNPMRLEQRIGRVDRIGQTRRVHALHLVAADTAETEILARLRMRLTTAGRDVGAPDPLGYANGEDTPDTARIDGSLLFQVDLREAATEEAGRLCFARRIAVEGDAAALARLEADGAWVAIGRRSDLRRVLGPRSLVLWRVRFEDALGRTVESKLIPLLVEAKSRAGDAEFRARVTAEAGSWLAEAERVIRSYAATRLAREHAVADALRRGDVTLFQGGLFDRREERARLETADIAASLDRLVTDRIRAVTDAASIRAAEPDWLLAIVPPR